MELEKTTDLLLSEDIALNSTQGPETNFMAEVETLFTYKVSSIVVKFWFPILVPIGLVGNTLSFLIMTKPANRKMSTCIYMAAISINDNIMMLIGLRIWLVTYVKIHGRTEWDCRIFAFFGLMSLQNAIFQVVAMTVDKFIAVKWPHKAAIYSTTARAKWTIISVYFFCVLFNVPHLFLSRLFGLACVAYATGGVYAELHSWLTFVINSIIPFVSLITMNLIIFNTVRKSHKKFSTMQSGHRSNHENENTANISRNKSKQNVENQLTGMLLLVTTLFLILLIPTFVRYVYTSYANRDTPTSYAGYMLFYQLSVRLYYTNSGINFFLYCISGKKFREDLKELLHLGRNFRSSSKDEEKSISSSLSFSTPGKL